MHFKENIELIICLTFTMIPDRNFPAMWVHNLHFPFFQNYSGQGGGSGGGDEDYEIPPITPPNHPDPSLLHLMDPESAYFCHPLPHNGLINPYNYPELPAIMMSNMLAQDGHLLSSQMPSVSYLGILGRISVNLA